MYLFNCKRPVYSLHKLWVLPKSQPSSLFRFEMLSPSRTTDVQSTEGDVTHFYMCSWLHIIADTAQTAQKQLTWIS